MPSTAASPNVSIKAMRHLKLYRILLVSSLNWTTTALFACSCLGIPTTEQAYKQSELVVTGRIIGMDTINSSNAVVTYKKGIKIGKHKYSLYSERFVRVKILVEKNLKESSNLPDTIYVLTEVECGYSFMPYLGEGYVDKIFYQYIVYGDKWAQKSIEKIKKGRKYVSHIKTTIRSDTFYTSKCKRTQHINEEELKRLEKI